MAEGEGSPTGKLSSSNLFEKVMGVSDTEVQVGSGSGNSTVPLVVSGDLPLMKEELELDTSDFSEGSESEEKLAGTEEEELAATLGRRDEQDLGRKSVDDEKLKEAQSKSWNETWKPKASLGMKPGSPKQVLE